MRSVAVPQLQRARARWPQLYGTTLLLSLALLALTGLFAWHSWLTTKQDQLVQLQTVAELTEKATDRYFLQTQRALGSLADDLTDSGGLSDLERAQRLLFRFQQQHPELHAINLLRLDGQFLATSRTTSLTGLPTAAGHRDFADIVANLDPAVPMELSRPLEGPVSKRWILPLRYTVRDAQGKAIAFIVAAAPVEMLQSFWSDAPIVNHASIGLVRDDGYLISRYPLPAGSKPEEVYGKPRDGAVFRFLREQQFPVRGYVEGANRLADAVFANAFIRLEHYPVTLVVGMPVRAVAEAWWQRTRLPLGLAALAIATVAIALYRLRAQELQTTLAKERAAENLRASEAFLERIGRVAGVGGWSMDLETRAIAWTSQTYRIHEVDGTHHPTVENGIQFYAPDARPIISAAVKRGIEDGTPWDLELPFVTAQGRHLWVRAFGEVEFDAGRPVRIVGAFQDVTEYRQRRVQLQEEQSLRQQAERHADELEALLSERGRMLDVLAHEVRQPLHNASAALQSAHHVLAGYGGVDASAPLARVQAVLGQVTSSIDNTLAVAALLAHPDPIRLEDTDIDTTLAVVIADLAPDDRERIVIERQTSTRTIVADMSLVRLALRNLLSNALRHGGGNDPVTIRVADSDHPLATFVDVVDTGPGVDPSVAGRLFERGAKSSSSPGYGLGLFIIQRVMELHAGHAVLVSNTPGNVVFRLSFEQAEDD